MSEISRKSYVADTLGHDELDSGQTCEAVEWDELDEVLVIGIDSEGRRRVYSSTGDYAKRLWLVKHGEQHIDDAMRAAQNDVT